MDYVIDEDKTFRDESDPIISSLFERVKNPYKISCDRGYDTREALLVFSCVVASHPSSIIYNLQSAVPSISALQLPISSL